jgi:hypothetical protein
MVYASLFIWLLIFVLAYNNINTFAYKCVLFYVAINIGIVFKKMLITFIKVLDKIKLKPVNHKYDELMGNYSYR